MYKYLIASALLAITFTSIPTLEAAVTSSGIGATLQDNEQIARRGYYGGFRDGYRGFGGGYGYGGYYSRPYNYYYTRPYYNAYPSQYYYTNPYGYYYYNTAPGLSFQFGW